MDKSKPYSSQVPKPQMAYEPTVAYNSSLWSTEEFLQAIPETTMRNMVNGAIK